MAANGWSPATRLFEAAGAGACLITDAWNGIEDFLEPWSEVLVARDGTEVAQLLAPLTTDEAAAIGAAARRRLLEEHTYARRAELVERTLERVHA
jgi:spore maturation protein CgeB